MSFEDDNTELKEFFSSRIEKILNMKLERLSKIDNISEEVSQLRAENKGLRDQNIKLENQITSLNASLQEFCQQARAELKELTDNQSNLQKLLKQDIQSYSENSSNAQPIEFVKSRPKSQPILVPIKGSKAESFGARTSHTDMDHPDRLLTPPIPSQSNDVSREKTL